MALTPPYTMFASNFISAMSLPVKQQQKQQGKLLVQHAVTLFTNFMSSSLPQPKQHRQQLARKTRISSSTSTNSKAAQIGLVTIKKQ